MNIYIDGDAKMENIKTTVLLRKDVYQGIVNQFGKREISSTINELLFRELIKPKTKSMFGVDKGMKPFKREHYEHF